jgi:hypothetical protein
LVTVKAFNGSGFKWLFAIIDTCNCFCQWFNQKPCMFGESECFSFKIKRFGMLDFSHCYLFVIWILVVVFYLLFVFLFSLIKTTNFRIKELELSRRRISTAIPGFPRSATGQTGMALMPIVLTFVIAGALIGAGMHLVGPVTRRMRTEATRHLLDRASRSVIAWSVANGRLPTSAEFFSAAGVRDDPWHRPLIYVYDGNLANAAGGGICGRTSSGIVANGVADTAFLIVSGGENFNVDSTPDVSGAYSGSAAVSALDLAEVVIAGRSAQPGRLLRPHRRPIDPAQQ